MLLKYFCVFCPIRHILPHLVVAHDVDGPRTEASSCVGLGPDVIGMELWLSQVFLLHHIQTGFRDVLFIISKQGLQKVIHLKNNTVIISYAFMENEQNIVETRKLYCNKYTASVKFGVGKFFFYGF